MDYIRFFSKNKSVITFGFILTLFSSFGQTFFISLYVPGIIKELQVSNSSFGAIYGSATILSSITLAYVGKFIDTVDIRKYTIITASLLMISCLVMAFSFNLIFVFIGFWGLRLAGQGLLSHIANTSISKIYSTTRGKALSLASLGYPAGEAIFPVLTGFIILFFGWRYSMILNSAIIFTLLIPFVFTIMKRSDFTELKNDKSISGEISSFSRSALFRDENFYIIALSSSTLPFIVTGLFFYQLLLSQEKGWPAEWLPACFIGYAGGRAIFSLISGKLIDRYTAQAIFPFYLIPFAIGLFTISLFSHPAAAIVYLFLSGVTVGISGPVKTALLAEFYGTENLGGIRSIFATLMVLSTAISPALFGYLIDSGFTFSLISGVSFIAVLISIMISFRLDVSYSLDSDSSTELQSG
jgi:MFS family permease